MEVKTMTRCKMLDEWFDDESKRIDSIEAKTGLEFVTGEPKSKKSLWSRWSKLWSFK